MFDAATASIDSNGTLGAPVSIDLASPTPQSRARVDWEAVHFDERLLSIVGEIVARVGTPAQRERFTSGRMHKEQMGRFLARDAMHDLDGFPFAIGANEAFTRLSYDLGPEVDVVIRGEVEPRYLTGRQDHTRKEIAEIILSRFPDASVRLMRMLTVAIDGEGEHVLASMTFVRVELVHHGIRFVRDYGILPPAR